MAWLIALTSDSGLRLAEAAELSVYDINLHCPIPYVDIKLHPWRRLKTISSASLTVTDIVPTHHLLVDLNKSVAKAYYHWFFLAQPAPLPETLITTDPDYFYQSCFLGWGAAKLTQFSANQLAAYRAAWRDPDNIRGRCDDYRATLKYDFDLDTADLHSQLKCPALIPAGADGIMNEQFNMRGGPTQRLVDLNYVAIPGDHFFVDQNPKCPLNQMNGFSSHAIQLTSKNTTT